MGNKIISGDIYLNSVAENNKIATKGDITGGATYTAGTNIDITNNVISVTGITVPTKTSDLTNDSGFLTEHQSLSNYSTITQMNSAISIATNDMATKTWVGQQGFLTSHQSLANYSTTTQMNTAIASAVTDMATQTWVNGQGFLTAHQSLANYSTTAQMISAISSAVSGKQDTLIGTQTTGQNIKTINGESILGTGNITIQGGGASYSAGTGIDITSNTISVTSAISSGAALGTTAVQPSAISDMATQTWVNSQGFLTAHQSLANYSTTAQMNSAISAAVADKALASDLTSHTGNSSIHVTSSDKSAWNAKYDKPSGGIPAGDMTTAVQASLALADTALQAHQDIKTVNGNTITGTGDVQVGTVTSIGITPGTGIEVSGSPVTSAGSITVGLPTTVIGSTTRTSISSIPVTHRAVLVTISATGTLSFAALPADGFEVHVIIRNTGSSTISITLPSSGSYICTSESTIYVAAGAYAEVNLLTIGTTGYIHGISSI